MASKIESRQVMERKINDLEEKVGEKMLAEFHEQRGHGMNFTIKHIS